MRGLQGGVGREKKREEAEHASSTTYYNYNSISMQQQQFFFSTLFLSFNERERDREYIELYRRGRYIGKLL